MWLVPVVMAFLLHKSGGLMCYQCSDSSDKKGANDCQTYVKTMNYNRKKFYETGEMRKYVKNCTGFADVAQLDVRCLIMWVQDAGSVRTYIRDCTEGSNFFNADYNVEFQDVTADNKSKCVNTNQGYLACVTMCDYEMGDFCNGPSGAATVNISLALLAFITVLWILRRNTV